MKHLSISHHQPFERWRNAIGLVFIVPQISVYSKLDPLSIIISWGWRTFCNWDQVQVQGIFYPVWRTLATSLLSFHWHFLCHKIREFLCHRPILICTWVTPEAQQHWFQKTIQMPHTLYETKTFAQELDCPRYFPAITWRWLMWERIHWNVKDHYFNECFINYKYCMT